MGSLQSRGRFCAAFAALVFGALLPIPGLVRAAEPTLEIAVGGETRSYTRDELLARPDATTLEVPKDVTYGGPMTYRAVPVAALLSGLNFPPDSVMQAVAIDGFAAQIPRPLAQYRCEQGHCLGRDRDGRSPMAQDRGQGLHRRAALRGLDRGRGGEHQERILGISIDQIREPAFAGRTLARARR